MTISRTMPWPSLLLRPVTHLLYTEAECSVPPTILLSWRTARREGVGGRADTASHVKVTQQHQLANWHTLSVHYCGKVSLAIQSLHTPTVTMVHVALTSIPILQAAVRGAIEPCRFVFVAFIDVPPRRYLIAPPSPLPSLIEQVVMEGQSRLRLQHTTPHIG